MALQAYTIEDTRLEIIVDVYISETKYKAALVRRIGVYMVGVVSPDGTVSTWQADFPVNDVIGYWRTLFVLACLNPVEIDEDLIKGAYYTVSRHTIFGVESLIKKVRSKVGGQYCKGLMKEEVPKQVLDLLVPHNHATLYLLPLEIRAGTVTWDDRFLKLGLKKTWQLKLRSWLRSRFL